MTPLLGEQQFHAHLLEANHELLRDQCRAVIEKRKAKSWLTRLYGSGMRERLARLYLAKSYYLCGDWSAAQETLDTWLSSHPNDPDARYLATDVARMAGDRRSAWDHLKQIYLITKRRKTWLYMAQLVQSSSDWQNMRSYFEEARARGLAVGFHPDMVDYLAAGAQRGGDIEHALGLWREALGHMKPARLGRKKLSKAQFSERRAEQALVDVYEALKRAGIVSFLISGTLLGCIRENRLLSHDNDIDIGVWDDIDTGHLQLALVTYGVFHVMPRQYDGCLRVRHINGIAIDVFTHYRETADYWHGGGKVRWHNTPFDLKAVEFIGRTFLVPSNAHLYLDENYGDWVTPKSPFDSTLDTPNAEVLCTKHLTLHAYRQAVFALREADSPRFERYRGLLADLGEPVLTKTRFGKEQH